MLLTLPAIVLLAALLYFVASRAGWLESIARWSERKPPSGRAIKPSPAAPKGEASARRLEVFEEFLRSLGRDDPKDS